MPRTTMPDEHPNSGGADGTKPPSSPKDDAGTETLRAAEGEPQAEPKGRLATTSPDARAKVLRIVRWAFVLALIAVFVDSAVNELKKIHWHEVRVAFQEIDHKRIGAAVVLLLLNYLILTL